MSCAGAGSYDQQRLAFKKHKKKLSNQFKTRFIALWEEYGEFQVVDGVRCFAGYRIDGDGEGQKRMSWLLKQPKLWEETKDKHFDWVKLVFALGKLQTITADDVEAFFEYYKNNTHNKGADRLHYKFQKVIEPDDYGYYTTEHVVTEHWFDRKIVTETDGVEVITWEKIEGDDFLDELSWELADLALDDAVWFDPYEITEIVADIELTEAELDEKIDELRILLPLSETYRVATIGEKIREYTIEQSVGDNVLDDLEYVNYYGDDGQYYLSVDAAKKMNGEVFMKLVVKTMDFRTKLKSKYKWRKRLLFLVAVVASGVALFFGQPHIAASIMLSYIGSITTNKTLKVLAQIASIAVGGAGSGFSAIGASEAFNLIMNVASLYFTLQSDKSVPIEHTEDGDEEQRLFYKMPYDLYDDIYCFDELVSVSVEIS
jgi:hypothetical protein